MTQTKTDPWFLGIDLGTSSCKTILIDQRGRVLGGASGEYPGPMPANGWGEQAPEAIVQGMIRCARKAIDDVTALAENCGGVSIGGTLHSLMAVDADGQPLTNVLTWADNRAARQAARVRESDVAQALYRETGCPVHAMYPLYKAIWLQEEHPDLFERAVHFVSSKEYVVARLTGQYLLDYATANGTGLLDTHTLDWSQAALAQAGLKPDRLSPLHDPRHRVTGLDTELAAAMGIAPDTPLVLGASDAANSNLGAGCVRPEHATCMIGTSGALRVIAPDPHLDPAARTWCYAIDADHWLVGGALSNGGLALDWLRRFLQSAQLPRAGSSLTFDNVLDLAAEAPPGADGLLCLPLLVGERSPHWNSDARGVLIGLAAEHEARHVARALLEGVAFQMRSVQTALHELVGQVHQVRVSGGITRSPLWLQILASVLGQRLDVPRWGGTSSLGAALWAMLGTGAIDSLEQLEHIVPIGDSVDPEDAEVRAYDQLYDVYEHVYGQVENLFEPLVALQATSAATVG